jgi:hypothetical protein
MILKHRFGRRGIVAPTVALSLTLVVAIAAISVDGGVLMAERQHAQATADAAAMAAATDLYANFPKNSGMDSFKTAFKAAYDLAADNGYTNDGKTSIVKVNIPPASGPYAGLAGYAEVLVTFNQPPYFSGLFGSNPLPINARAVARGAWAAPNIGILVLQYTGKGTLNTQGTGASTTSGAPVIVNSNDPSAAIDAGTGTMIAPEFDVTGGYVASGGGSFVGPIYTGVHPTPDPLAYLPVPTAPPLGTMNKTSLSNGNFQYDLYPGTYYNLPNFNQGDVVIFHQASSNNNGGIFYLGGGGLKSTGANLIMGSGETGGIMLYNAGTGTNDQINISGNSSGTVNLSPLTNGPYTGLTLFQARNATEPVNVQGNGNFSILGTFYVAGALLSIAGNGGASNIGSQYVSDDLAITGGGNVNIQWAGPPTAKARIIKLVE